MNTSGPRASGGAATPTLVGASLKRKEDWRFLTGRGRYVDDLWLAGLAHLALVRSPHAHARVLGIDARRALRRQGVLAVLTVKDAPELAASTTSPSKPATSKAQDAPSPAQASRMTAARSSKESHGSLPWCTPIATTILSNSAPPCAITSRWPKVNGSNVPG